MGNNKLDNEGYDIKIPHRWCTIGFRIPWWDGLQKPRPQEKYKELNMFNRNKEEKYIKYPNIIADVRNDITEIEIEIIDIQKSIILTDKQIK